MENTKGTATYCPEDNKIRLYVGRVPKEDYLRLKAAGFTSTPKQACDFVATWTPFREDLALEFADLIEDEDQTPEERAADRAERFSEYREKRLGEAVGHADRFDAGPSVHGFQDYGRAVRSADRHDRIAGRAVSAWDKAEYWQRRTAGVISNALYKSDPGVRMGRIKTLEAEHRKFAARLKELNDGISFWKKVLTLTDPDKAFKAAYFFANCKDHGHRDYKHPRPDAEIPERVRTNGGSLYTLLTLEQSPITGHEAATLWLNSHPDPDSEVFRDTWWARWLRHLELRLAYENQMLTAAGGMLEQKEVEVGGKISGRLILRVAKSPVTKRATSAQLLGPAVQGWVYRAKNLKGTEYAEHQFDLERISPGAYTPPTPESLKELEEIRSKIKAATPKKEFSLINPTLEDAQRLMDRWNAAGKAEHDAVKESQCLRDYVPTEVRQMTQAEYSERSKGTYGSCKTAHLCQNGKLYRSFGASYEHVRKAGLAAQGKVICAMRITGPGGEYSHFRPQAIVVLTDKPQKPFPKELWNWTPPKTDKELVAA